MFRVLVFRICIVVTLREIAFFRSEVQVFGTFPQMLTLFSAMVPYVLFVFALFRKMHFKFVVSFSDISDSSLKYLNSEQALADLAAFSQSMARKFNLTSSKWISFGGSYPGSLSAWFRLKYPHLVHGRCLAICRMYSLRKKNFLRK